MNENATVPVTYETAQLLRRLERSRSGVLGHGESIRNGCPACGDRRGDGQHEAGCPLASLIAQVDAALGLDTRPRPPAPIVGVSPLGQLLSRLASDSIVRGFAGLPARVIDDDASPNYSSARFDRDAYLGSTVLRCTICGQPLTRGSEAMTGTCTDCYFK